jgi:hypothetical protein
MFLPDISAGCFRRSLHTMTFQVMRDCPTLWGPDATMPANLDD